MNDRTALSYWFPKLEAAGIPVPRTIIVPMPKEAQETIWHAFDGKEAPEANVKAIRDFQGKLSAAGAEVGFPCFLRTDHTSGKHNWERTCFLTKPEDVPQHIFDLAEFSEIYDFIGLPWSTWVVREFLPTIPLGTCPHYGNMPLCREFRFFVDSGKVRCWHPYWPIDSLEQGGADVSLYQSLAAAPADYEALHELAERVSEAIEGAWSVDILETRRGWYVTDMAEAEKSFHWKGCERLTYPETKP